MSQRSYSKTHRPANRPPHCRRLEIEQLEDRRLLSVVTVDTALDVIDFTDGVTSLREAIFATNTVPGADEIVFDFGHDGPEMIQLTQGEISITDALTITGSGTELLTIDASGNDPTPDQNLGDGSRIFTIDAGNFDELATVTISGITLTGGDVFGDGGAINTRENLRLINMSLRENAANGRGGALAAYNPVGGELYGAISVDIANSTISENSAGFRGGGMDARGEVTVSFSTISGNDASVGGGIAGNHVMVIASTISGNSAERGGGMDVPFGDVTLTSSTVTNNQVSIRGGGIWVEGVTSTAALSHTIVAGNLRTSANTLPMADDLAGNSTFGLGYSLVGTAVGAINTTPGTINYFGVDPRLGPLQDNGGPTKTHALLPGSPAIDAGDPLAMAGVANIAEFDQRGAPYARVADGDGDGIARIDIGAYEVPNTFVVDTLVDESDGDFSQGDLSLREAIERANAAPGPNNILFDAGLFASPQTVPLTLDELEIIEALTLNGPGQDLLTIDAQQQSRIFNITATEGDFTIAGMTLSGGRTTEDNADSMDNTYSGGAIRSLTAGRLTIRKSTVHGNVLNGDFTDGGGIFAVGDVMISSSTISGNRAAGSLSEGSGGGIYTSGNVTVNSSTIARNVARYGGGIWAYGNVTVSSSTITRNLARYGGGIRAGGEVTVSSSTISGNSASSRGGGIRAGGEVTVSSSTISGNFGFLVGGGIQASGEVTVSSSTISGNSASLGGGIVASGAVTVRSSTISGNWAQSRGGGIFAIGAVTVRSSTISGNSASFGRGGGIWADSDALIMISHSIVAGNTADFFSPDAYLGTGPLVVRYSLIGDNRGISLAEAPIGAPDDNGNLIGDPGGLGIINPHLGALADNGGPTKTHALMPGSPAIDAGDPTIPPDANQFDQRGGPYVRVFGSRIDMGAFERQPVAVPQGALVVDTRLDEFDSDFSAGDLSLREAVWIANFRAGADTITFDPALGSGQIMLSQGQLGVFDALTVDATALTGGLTIDGSGRAGSRIFDIDDGDPGIDSPVTIRGLMLTGGNTYYVGGGGAIHTEEPLTVSSSTISGNSARSRGGGGGIYATGNVTVNSSTISGNSASSPGGGIRAGGDVTVSFSTISGNSAGFRGGGGIYASGNVMVSSSTISGNRAISGNGGGIWAFRGVTVDSSTISGNTTNYGDGGGIYTSGGVTVSSSTISGNTANYGDGGGIWAFSDVTVSSSTISGNSASSHNGGNGGGIYTSGGVTVSSSTISGNFAYGLFAGGDGGGIGAFGDVTVTINHSIVAGNTANSLGPDVLPGTGPLVVRYSLIGDNTDTNLAEAPIGMPDAHGNLIGGPIHGIIDPHLGPLADNGGLTKTHALLPGSPAIDAGDPAIQQDPITFDQRGNPFLRVTNGDPQSAIAIDIGAYEAQLPPSADFDNDHDVDGRDFLVWQRGNGTSGGATRPDGNSDDDMDVDASDLAAWEVSFETQTVPLSSPLVLSSEPSSFPSARQTETDPAPGPMVGPRVELLEAALALFNSEQQATRLALPQSTVVQVDHQNQGTAEEVVFTQYELPAQYHVATVTRTELANPNGRKVREVDGFLAKVMDKVFESLL